MALGMLLNMALERVGYWKTGIKYGMVLQYVWYVVFHMVSTYGITIWYGMALNVRCLILQYGMTLNRVVTLDLHPFCIHWCFRVLLPFPAIASFEMSMQDCLRSMDTSEPERWWWW